MYCVTALKKIDAARAVFEKLPPDSVDVVHKNWLQQVKLFLQYLSPFLHIYGTKKMPKRCVCVKVLVAIVAFELNFSSIYARILHNVAQK